ncbi:MAG TPA: folylpolyglutamate synthase/dihydrofolate synthase family protein [Candidatus Thermoplasmatota archaeon]
MRYEEALSWLYARQRFGIKQGLENVERLLTALERPQESFVAIHVTGSNGKGSVCAFLDAALRAAGHSVGRYISPHLTSFTERITVDGKEIPRADVALLAEQMVPVVADLESQGVVPTFFEVVTAMAFLYFRRRRVPLAVVEVGMGGWWDATNVVKPVVSIITNVGLEHTDRLGSTVAAIALEKAGIIKAETPLVTRAVGDAYDVIRRRAKELGAPIHFAAAPEAKEYLDRTETGVSYFGNPVTLRLRALGRHQADNASLAATALQALGDAFPVGADALRRGFENAVWPGRLEHASKNPLVLLDGAHNPPAIQTLFGFLERVVAPRPIRVLFSAMRDKNVPAMVRTMAPLVKEWVVTAPSTDRAVPAKILAETLRKEGVPAEPVDDVVEAIRRLHRDADADDVLVITGSLFLVGEARAALLKPNVDPAVEYARQQ